jgi:hypothetical protein
MSALGQKPTCAAQNAMSALASIATAKADIRKSSCLLYPRKRTCAVQLGMSALGQKRTFRHPLDHLVGAQYIDGGIVRPSAVAVSAFSAITSCIIGNSPLPRSEPERVFTSGQPAIADEILGIERRCFTASLPGART